MLRSWLLLLVVIFFCRFVEVGCVVEYDVGLSMMVV